MLQQSNTSRYSGTTVLRIGSRVMTCGKLLPSTFGLGAGLFALVMAHTAQAAPLLTPVSPSVSAGNTVTLTLSDTIVPGSNVGGVTLQVTFNTALLSLQSVANGTLLNEPDSEFDAPVVNGTSTGALISIQQDPNANDEPTGTGSIVTLTLLAFAADGNSLVPVIVQSDSGSLGVYGEYQLAPTSDTVTITATPTKVPEPGTIALLLAPVLAGAGLTRRNRC